ncbi:MAG: ABC transporter permease, partial [Bdellovibrionales bacterium]|nr:ABC transporter permease [Bdellovibrionales bacterium]
TFSLSWRVAVRHWLIFRKDLFANVSPTIIDPTLFLICLGLGLGAYVNQVEGLSYARYVAPGLAVSTALFTAFFECSYNFYVRLTFENIYKAILTTPIGPREILFGEFIWIVLKGMGMTSMVTLWLVVFGFCHWEYALLMPILGGLVSFACGALGLIASSLVKNINQFQTVYSLVISPMFFFSGIFFPIKDLFWPLRWLANLSPFYHGVSLGQHILWARELGVGLAIHGSALLALSFLLGAIAYRRVHPLLYK